MAMEAGTTLGPYRVSKKLGAGGMGEVYAATDTRLGRTVAIKVLPKDMLKDADSLRRFQQEANTVAALNHPNIVQVYDVGTAEDGSPFLVMELLEGECLRTRMDKPMPLRKVVEICSQLAKALGAAHAKNIIHRDLKPENVYLTKPGPAKILDFGLAKLAHHEETPLQNDATQALFTKPGMVMGTVGYMAPEQVEGLPTDGRADIFALGVMMWEMLSGRRPFRKDSSIDTLHAILREDPPEIPHELGVPSAMERILRRCLEKDPEDRFQSANDLAFQLATVGEMSGSATTVSMSAIRESSSDQTPWYRTPHRLFYPLPIKLPSRLRICFWDRVQLSLAYLLLACVFLALLGMRMGWLPFGLSGNREIGKRFTPAMDVTGNIQSAVISRDGQHTLVSLADETGKTNLLYARAGQSTVTLDKAPAQELLAISNTGTALLKDATGELFLLEMGENANAMKIATHVLESDLSPDGSKVALLKRSGDKFAVEFPQGATLYSSQQRLLNIKISPKGDALAFLERDAASNLFLLKVWKNGKLTTWHGGKALCPKGGFSIASLRGMAWDNEGKGLYLVSGDLLGFVSERGEKILHRNAGSIRLCGATTEGPLLSVGTELVSDRGHLAGSNKEVDIGWIGGSLNAISKDGSRLLVARDNEIWLLPSDRSKGHKIGTGTAETLSQDGKTVLFTNNERTLAVPTEGGDSILIASRDELKGLGFTFSGDTGDPKFVLSEDGKWVLVFQKQLLLRKSLNGAGSFERLAVPVDGLAADWRVDAVFTLDGNRLALQVRESGEQRWCLLVDLSAKKQESKIQMEDAERLMAWQKEGTCLVFSSSQGSGEFRVLDPKTGKRKALFAPAPPYANATARFRSIRSNSEGTFYAYRYVTTGLSQLMIGKGLK